MHKDNIDRNNPEAIREALDPSIYSVPGARGVKVIRDDLYEDYTGQPLQNSQLREAKRNEVVTGKEGREGLVDNPKYVLTGNTKNIQGTTLHEIKALRDFGLVKAGDFGGFIASEDNLSHKGNAWVFRGAQVYDKARVEGNAYIGVEAKVTGRAIVRDNAIVTDFAVLKDNAIAEKNSMVSEQAKLGGNALISGDTMVKGQANIDGNVRIDGKSTVSGDTRIEGNVNLRDRSVLNNIDWEQQRGKLYEQHHTPSHPSPATEQQVEPEKKGLLQRIWGTIRGNNNSALPMAKYEMTDATQEVNGHQLRQIRALRDFADVKKGDLGGWIEKEANLEQDGESWVYDQAKVYGNALVAGDAKIRDNAVVKNQALVFGQTEVSGDARVRDQAKIMDNARVSGQADVYGRAEVRNNAVVSDNARISGDALIADHAVISQQGRVFDHATVEDYGKVSGTAWIYDSASVTGHAVVEGAKVHDWAVAGGNAEIKGRVDISGSTQLLDNARLSGNVVVTGDSRIEDNVSLSGNVKVEDSRLTDNVSLTGTAQAIRTEVSGNRVYDKPQSEEASKAVEKEIEDYALDESEEQETVRSFRR